MLLTRVFLVFVGIVTPLLSGCFTLTSATWGPPPPDLTVIKVGATRDAIERALGKPMKRENNVSTYEYNTRDAGGLGMVLLGAFVDVATLGTSAVYGPDILRAREAQRAKVSIVYGPGDKVIGSSREAAEAEYRQWLHSKDRKEELHALCSAANAGSAPAQLTHAMRYWYGLWGGDVDHVRGYLWLRLAAFGGHRSAAEATAEWAASMTPEEIAEADRLFRDWEPEPCS